MAGNYLTSAELAGRLRITSGTLANWRVKGKGPSHIKLAPGRAGAVRYSEDEVLAWEEAQRRKEP